jgi:hypothetical protein
MLFCFHTRKLKQKQWPGSYHKNSHYTCYVRDANFVSIKFIVVYIYNICALSKHIGNMCMRLRNGGKRRGFAEPFPAFRAEYTYLPICFDSAHVLYLSCNFKS